MEKKIGAGEADSWTQNPELFVTRHLECIISEREKKQARERLTHGHRIRRMRGAKVQFHLEIHLQVSPLLSFSLDFNALCS